MPECDRCDGMIDADDRYFVIDNPAGDCAEYVCRKCRGGMSDQERDELRQILGNALALQKAK